MQYNTQWVFHLSQYPGPFLHTSRPLKTFNTWSFSSGSSTACFSIHIIWYSGWCQSSFSKFLLLSKSVTHFLRPYRRHKSHTDPQDKLYQHPPACQIKENNRRKIKQMWGKANMGMISFTDGDSQVKEKSKRLSLVPDVSVLMNHVEASSHLWYKTKTFHLLFLLTFFTFTSLHYKSFEKQLEHLDLCCVLQEKSFVISAPLHASLSFTHFSFPL